MFDALIGRLEAIREFFTDLLTGMFTWVTDEWQKVFGFVTALVAGWVLAAGFIRAAFESMEAILAGMVVPELDGSVGGVVMSALAFVNSWFPVNETVELIRAWLALVIACMSLSLWSSFARVLRWALGFK